MLLFFSRVVRVKLPYTTTTTTTTTATTKMSLAAPPEAIYPDIDTAFTKLQEHAEEHGYAFFRYFRKPTRVYFACDRARKYDSRGKDPDTHSSKQRKNTGSKKCGCPMKLVLRLDSLSNQWTLKVLEATHNHGPSVQ
jgi:hypothetical protein